MISLITAAEFSDYKNISKKVDVDKINQCIELAQSVDLYDYLGDFLFDVVTNYEATGSYSELINGSTFTIDGYSYTHSGLKSLLADLTYSRYIYESNINHTPFGMVQKLSQDSQPIDRNIIKDISKQAQIDADIKFKTIDKFLVENSTTFSRYCKGDNKTINTFSQRFTIL